MSADGGPVLIILLFTMANIREVGVGPKDTSTEPDGVALHHILHHVNFNRLWLVAGRLRVRIETGVDALLDQLV